MSGHRNYRRKRSPETSSSDSSSRSITRSSMPTSTMETDKPSSASLPVRRSPASRRHPSWVLLNRAGAPPDGFPGDRRTTSATSRTSRGDEISVSFELVEPPGTSVLIVDCPQASTTTRKFYGNVIAAHRDVVLLAITSYDDENSPDSSVADLFVYQASRRLPSLLLLPASAGGPVHLMYYTEAVGIMSCTSSSNDDDDSPSFVVAYLEMITPTTNDARLFRSGTGQWESLQNLHVHGAHGDHRDLLHYWTTNEVVRYGRQYLIWVDYYRGVLLMDRLSSSSETNLPASPPRLRYVPLPVNRVKDPEHIDYGDRGCPRDSRSVCVTRYGIKFVSIDSQHWSDFGLGNHHVLTWNHRFRITTWSLREEDYSWRRDATVYEEEFWDAVHGAKHHRFRFPHGVQPEFPVVDVENPDVVPFRLETKWMIEVDLRKKVLLAATATYSKKESDDLSDDEGFDEPIYSELPRYLDGGQALQEEEAMTFHKIPTHSCFDQILNL